MAECVDTLVVSSSGKFKQKIIKCSKCYKNVRKCIVCMCCKELKHELCFTYTCEEGEDKIWKCCDCATNVATTDGVGLSSTDVDIMMGPVNLETHNYNEVCDLKMLVRSMMEDIESLKEENKSLRNEIDQYLDKAKSHANDSPTRSLCDDALSMPPAIKERNYKKNRSLSETLPQCDQVLPSYKGRSRKKIRNSVGQIVKQFEKKACDDSVVVIDDEMHLVNNSVGLSCGNTSATFPIETIINKRSTKVEKVLKDVIVMGDSLVRLSSQVAPDLKDCTYFYPGMRLENVAQALERLLVNTRKPKTILLHFGTNNVKYTKCLDVITGEAYDMLTKIK